MPAQPAFERVDHIVDGADGERRIDAAVEIYDFARGSFPHADIVHLTKSLNLINPEYAPAQVLRPHRERSLSQRLTLYEIPG